MSQDQKNLKYLCFVSIALGVVLAAYGLVAWLGLGKLELLDAVVTIFAGFNFLYGGFVGAQKANTLTGIDKFSQEAYAAPVFPVFMVFNYFLHAIDFTPHLVLAFVGIAFGAAFAFYVFSFKKKLAQQ